jgi:uncharacterized secreted protein with C-terminal beta-propeller domain
VSGELKIPGYSAYLHPLGDGLLLGVGQDADDEGRVLGAKATLFDVSDPANPRELGSWTKQDGYTDVEWDHLAFLYWAPDDWPCCREPVGGAVLRGRGPEDRRWPARSSAR